MIWFIFDFYYGNWLFITILVKPVNIALYIKIISMVINVVKDEWFTMVEYVVFFGLVSIGLVFLGLDVIRRKKLPVQPTNPYFDQLNKCESPIEKRVLKALWMRDYKATTQYPIRRYRIDLALPEYRLAIECDGKEFHSSKKAKAHDRKRDAYLRSIGWKTLRFSGSKINGDIGQVISRIESEIQKKHLSGCQSEDYKNAQSRRLENN